MVSLNNSSIYLGRNILHLGRNILHLHLRILGNLVLIHICVYFPIHSEWAWKIHLSQNLCYNPLSDITTFNILPLDHKVWSASDGKKDLGEKYQTHFL